MPISTPIWPYAYSTWFHFNSFGAGSTSGMLLTGDGIGVSLNKLERLWCEVGNRSYDEALCE
ncbi:MAG: hypothetical protein P1U50_12400 [Parvibaculaceae bacterium]|nr:hypothetical protein [Parvibaculaceae bacterium]